MSNVVPFPGAAAPQPPAPMPPMFLPRTAAGFATAKVAIRAEDAANRAAYGDLLDGRAIEKLFAAVRTSTPDGDGVLAEGLPRIAAVLRHGAGKGYTWSGDMALLADRIDAALATVTDRMRPAVA